MLEKIIFIVFAILVSICVSKLVYYSMELYKLSKKLKRLEKEMLMKEDINKVIIKFHNPMDDDN